MTVPFLEIIESITPDPNTLIWRFEDTEKKIKNGASLTVRENQCAMLLKTDKHADIFKPGVHKLTIKKNPTSSKDAKDMFNDSFKADIYYFNMHQFIQLKWATPTPIAILDSNIGVINIKAFGVYDVCIEDIARFFEQYAKKYPQFSIFELEGEMRDFIVPQLEKVMIRNKYNIGDITDLNNRILQQLKQDFSKLGLNLTNFQILNITLPEEVTTSI